MSEYIDKDAAVDEGYLQDWYISSVSEDDEPVWTEAHIEELANDFIVIPNDTPAADVAAVIHSKWEIRCDGYGYCPYCGNCKAEPSGREMTKYCPNCGAKMDRR